MLLAACLGFAPLAPRRTPRTVVVHNAWERPMPYEEALAWQRDLHAERAAAVAAARGTEEAAAAIPADVLLVEKLSFRLENGQSLLLVGHNGSGKSSICTRDTAPFSGLDCCG